MQRTPETASKAATHAVSIKSIKSSIEAVVGNIIDEVSAIDTEMTTQEVDVDVDVDIDVDVDVDVDESKSTKTMQEKDEKENEDEVLVKEEDAEADADISAKTPQEVDVDVDESKSTKTTDDTQEKEKEEEKEEEEEEEDDDEVLVEEADEVDTADADDTNDDAEPEPEDNVQDIEDEHYPEQPLSLPSLPSLTSSLPSTKPIAKKRSAHASLNKTTTDDENKAWNALSLSASSSVKRHKISGGTGFAAHAVGSCQTHRSFSSEPRHLAFRYASSSTSLRNRLLLYGIHQANTNLTLHVEKVSRTGTTGNEMCMFPPNSVSKLVVEYPDRQPVNWFHDITIFTELASRYDLLGNDEATLSTSLSMASTFLRWDEMIWTASTDRKLNNKYKSMLQIEYLSLANHLSSKAGQDFSHAPALECAMLAHLIYSQKKKRPPVLPPIIATLYETLKEKYAPVLANEQWWEEQEEEEEEEEVMEEDDSEFYY
jgi:hypothetical protein